MWEYIKFGLLFVLVLLGIIALSVDETRSNRAGREFPSLLDRVDALEKRVGELERAEKE